ncbi:hypothetical protein H6P81_005303 [Aristolochia fimbriata]|uniref:Uncharacterized protein n=1 Tax=Aristolochia fimbriata TaxID=158543 RepID=A0AAV7EUT1_ARIFI|nr:hypothetical protein H6P81_005303 [Aristolochia fimbriata]
MIGSDGKVISPVGRILVLVPYRRRRRFSCFVFLNQWSKKAVSLQNFSDLNPLHPNVRISDLNASYLWGCQAFRTSMLDGLLT